MTTLPTQPDATRSGELSRPRSICSDRPGSSQLTKPLYCAVGLAAVGLAMLGVVVPGLPTTVFILIAVWAFARSSDTLDRVLIRRNPALRPFLRYLQPGATMPMRAKIISIALMWSATIASSVLIVTRSDNATPAVVAIVGTVLLAAALGTVAILSYGRKSETMDLTPGAG